MELSTSTLRRSRVARLALAGLVATTVGLGLGAAPASAEPASHVIDLRAIWKQAPTDVHSVQIIRDSPARPDCITLGGGNRGVGYGPAFVTGPVGLRPFHSTDCTGNAFSLGSTRSFSLHADAVVDVSATARPKVARYK